MKPYLHDKLQLSDYIIEVIEPATIKDCLSGFFVIGVRRKDGVIQSIQTKFEVPYIRIKEIMQKNIQAEKRNAYTALLFNIHHQVVGRNRFVQLTNQQFFELFYIPKVNQIHYEIFRLNYTESKSNSLINF